MLHITNGEATRWPLARSGVAGTMASWDDVLYLGRTPLAWGEDWWRVRARELAGAGVATEEEVLRRWREDGDPLASAGDHDEVVFWFEHDLHDQLLLAHHLWWLAHFRPPGPRFSIVIGTDYLGLLKPEQFPSRFAARRAVTDEEIALGSDVWRAFSGDEPGRLVPYADLERTHPIGRVLPHVPRAMRRLLEEFPDAAHGLSRSQRQILEVLSDGPRSPEQAFVAWARLEDDIWMGDSVFWSMARALAAAAQPLIAADVRDVPGRLPSGTLTVTDAGRQVLAGRADHLDLNAPSRWIGGTWLAPTRQWRWTGSSLRPPGP